MISKEKRVKELPLELDHVLITDSKIYLSSSMAHTLMYRKSQIQGRSEIINPRCEGMFFLKHMMIYTTLLLQPERQIEMGKLVFNAAALMPTAIPIIIICP